MEVNEIGYSFVLQNITLVQCLKRNRSQAESLFRMTCLVKMGERVWWENNKLIEIQFKCNSLSIRQMEILYKSLTYILHVYFLTSNCINYHIFCFILYMNCGHVLALVFLVWKIITIFIKCVQNCDYFLLVCCVPDGFDYGIFISLGIFCHILVGHKEMQGVAGYGICAVRWV